MNSNDTPSGHKPDSEILIKDGASRFERPADKPEAIETRSGDYQEKEEGVASLSTDEDKGTMFMALAFTVFGLFWMIASIRIPTRALVGTLGAGFLPFWVGVTLTALSALLFLHTFRKVRQAAGAIREDSGRKPGWQWRVLATFLALLLYIILLPHVHYFINTFFVSASGLALTGEPLKPKLLLIAGIISGALFLIFIYWFQIPLPGSRYFS